jgi:thymidylate kinase
MIIALEGPNNVGKSTIAALMTDFTVFHFPNYDSEIGKMIKPMLHQEKTINLCRALDYMFAADRRLAQSKIFGLALTRQNILFDRYIFSGFVYALHRYRRLGQDQCNLVDLYDNIQIRDLLNELDVGCLLPDHTFILTGDGFTDKRLEHNKEINNFFIFLYGARTDVTLIAADQPTDDIIVYIKSILYDLYKK